MADLSLLYVTCKDMEEGRYIAQALLKDHLVACVNLIPLTVSIYHWKGVLHENNEALMIVKTVPTLVSRVSLYIKKLHSYDCPLILEIPALVTDQDIFPWIKESIMGETDHFPNID